jgi:parvulin-like peptidyl-prolyl isomerase
MIIKSSRSSTRKIPSILLALGAVLGIFLAAFGLLEPSQFPRDDGAARVNQTVISQDSYQRLLNAMQSDKRSPLTKEDRKLILDRMIDEELLVQRGVELGLLELNSSVRNTLVRAVTTSVITGDELYVPTEQELQDFYQENIALFTQPARLHLQRIEISDKDDQAHTRIAAVMQKLRSGTAFNEVKKTHGDPAIFEVPGVPLPGAKLREYIGPTLLEEAMKLAPGEFTEPIAVQNKLVIIKLVKRIEAVTPALSSVQRQVKTEFKRKMEEETFKDYIQWLRDRADISLPERKH